MVLKGFLKINYLINVNFKRRILKDECISEKYYQRANNIWNVFKMNNG